MLTQKEEKLQNGTFQNKQDDIKAKMSLREYQEQI